MKVKKRAFGITKYDNYQNGSTDKKVTIHLIFEKPKRMKLILHEDNPTGIIDGKKSIVFPGNENMILKLKLVQDIQNQENFQMFNQDMYSIKGWESRPWVNPHRTGFVVYEIKDIEEYEEQDKESMSTSKARDKENPFYLIDSTSNDLKSEKHLIGNSLKVTKFDKYTDTNPQPDPKKIEITFKVKILNNCYLEKDGNFNNIDGDAIAKYKIKCQDFPPSSLNTIEETALLKLVRPWYDYPLHRSGVEINDGSAQPDKDSMSTSKADDKDWPDKTYND